MSPGKGRRRGRRWITEIPKTRLFEPKGTTKKGESVKITLEELEAIRLVDLLELQHQEAASYMGISRKTFWNDLRRGRKKVASALVYGLGITIEGGSYIIRESAQNPSTPPGESPEGKIEGTTKTEDRVRLLEQEMLPFGDELNQIRARMELLEKKGD